MLSPIQFGSTFKNIPSEYRDLESGIKALLWANTNINIEIKTTQNPDQTLRSVRFVNAGPLDSLLEFTDGPDDTFTVKTSAVKKRMRRPSDNDINGAVIFADFVVRKCLFRKHFRNFENHYTESLDVTG